MEAVRGGRRRHHEGDSGTVYQVFPPSAPAAAPKGRGQGGVACEGTSTRARTCLLAANHSALLLPTTHSACRPQRASQGLRQTGSPGGRWPAPGKGWGTDPGDAVAARGGKGGGAQKLFRTVSVLLLSVSGSGEDASFSHAFAVVCFSSPHLWEGGNRSRAAMTLK